MNTEQAAMMLKLQQLGLTMDDLREYLDTHLYDSKAIEYFNMTCIEYDDLQKEYSSKFSPLNSNSPSNSDSEWVWGLSDFPWDY